MASASRGGLLAGILDDDDGDDPILSVVNIIDVFLVIIAVLLIAVLENPLNPFTTQDAVVIKNPGQPQMEMLVKKGNELKHYKSSGQIGEGQGQKAGTRLSSERRNHGVCTGRRGQAVTRLMPVCSVGVPMMNSPAEKPLRLAAGERLYEAATAAGAGWHLLCGALRLDQGLGARDGFVQLFLPGDLVGLETLCGLPYQGSARALTECLLQPLPEPGCVSPSTKAVWLTSALTQQLQRAGDMAALRTGSTPERVKRLLLLLRPAREPEAASLAHLDAQAHSLPRIKDIANIVDSAPETVSRILSGLRRLQVLDERHAQFARFDRQRLDDCDLPAGLTRSSARPRPPRQPQTVLGS